MKNTILFLTFSVCKADRISEIKLPSSHHVKYMPSGYKDDQKLSACPAPSSSSSGGAGLIIIFSGLLLFYELITLYLL